MNEEERQAIEYLKFCTNDFKERYGGETTKQIDIYETVLNLIQKLHKENKHIHSELDKQQEKINNYAKEIEKKDKQIDLMVKEFKKQFRRSEPCDLDFEMECEKYETCEECIKNYFERKVEEDK